MNRRQFIRNTAITAAGLTLPPIKNSFAALPPNKLKTLVLGIDGMDIRLAGNFLRLGFLPNFAKLVRKGGIFPVASSFPPQSPVAWSSFSVGASPQVHGIYDFIHRDPATMIPYLSTSRVQAPEKVLKIKGYEIPLQSGEVDNLRQGRPFWEYLADYDIPTTIFKMPGNFPCENKRVKMISGMGTPDLRGGYGSFTLVTTNPPANRDKITGGVVLPVDLSGGYGKVMLPGPANTMKESHPTTHVPIEIWRDKKNAVVRLKIQGNELVLNQGEWTDWLRLTFPILKYVSDVKGICKIFIKSVHPHFSMYVSPINIDPADPALPIVSSGNYGSELARDLGPFYTQGMPEDTKALSYDVLSNGEYLDLAYQIIRERQAMLRHECDNLARLNNGMLFFYFSSLDQDTHMFWRAIDKESPLYTAELGREYGNVLRQLYFEMDKSLGLVLERFDLDDPEFRLIVMSDHGFAPFRRQVNLNSWLYENNYLSLYDPSNMEDGEYFSDVNWSKTAAYALGINAIYLNLDGRERFGSLADSELESVQQKIVNGLLALRDPINGRKVVSAVKTVSRQEKKPNPQAPDLIVGWNRGYRTSWTSILGGFEAQTIKDNDDKWSGDHCIDPALVPAILMSNKPIMNQNNSVLDITASILAEYNIPVPEQMPGSSIYMKG